MYSIVADPRLSSLCLPVQLFTRTSAAHSPLTIRSKHRSKPSESPCPTLTTLRLPSTQPSMPERPTPTQLVALLPTPQVKVSPSLLPTLLCRDYLADHTCLLRSRGEGQRRFPGDPRLGRRHQRQHQQLCRWCRRANSRTRRLGRSPNYEDGEWTDAEPSGCERSRRVQAGLERHEEVMRSVGCVLDASSRTLRELAECLTRTVIYQ